MKENTNIKLPADRQNLNRFIDFITDFAKKGGFHDKEIWELELAANEIFTNIINMPILSKRVTLRRIVALIIKRF